MRYLPTTLLLLFLFVTTTVLAQKKVTLSGYIRDAQSGESLISANVYIKELNLAVQTNTYGFYSVSMPQGSYTVLYNYTGYANIEEPMQMIESRTYNAELRSITTFEEVEVKAKKEQDNVQSTDMGTVALSVNDIKKLPVVFGEVDILKALQLMPGVQSSGEGNSGFYVRGGGPDQNLILLDDAVVYNPGHLFGFFSVFNSDAVKNITLIKGSMPAQYGGRLSSVVDVTMNEGNTKEYHAKGGIGLIASRLTVEGPIRKEKGSFMLSGRRTYIDVLMKPFAKGSLSGSGYFFYDANLKANYTLGKKDRLYLSGYFGRDKFTFKSSTGNFNANIPWGNATATLRWNHLFNDRLFMNASAIYNDYHYEFGGKQSDFAIRMASGIRDWNGKVDFDYYAGNNHHVKTGINYTHHTFIPNQVSGNSGELEFKPNNSLIRYAHEAGVYVGDEFEVAGFIKVNAGLRYSCFAQTGPYKQYKYNLNEEKIDSTQFGSGAIVKTYGGWEPRLNLRFELNENASIKTSVVKSYQYIHLITNNGTTLPTDLWVPSTYYVQPQSAWQYSLGYFQNLFNNSYVTSVEVYYKKMKHQIEYRQGYTPTNITRDQELDFVFGNGEAYGTEFFINKTKGKFTGWIGYTLSWTYRTFPKLNNGERYPAKYDRRHDLSVVLTYEHSKKWTFSGVFVYGSGNAITLPTSYYFIEQQLVPEYSKLNAYRLFAYHRLDLGATYTPKPEKKKGLRGSWTFSIYNVYSRQNPYFLYVDSRGNTSQGLEMSVKQVSIFPILPSITYNFAL